MLGLAALRDPDDEGVILALEDPAKVALLRRIKAAFDPRGILNPGLVAS